MTTTPSNLQIISISGLIGAGKDTIGAHLVEKYGFKRFSFSAAIKDCCAAIFGLDREMLDGLTKEAREWRDSVDEWWTDKLDMDRDFTRRDLIIQIGTELMRNHFHQDIWVFCLQRQILNHGGRIVLTDTRHLNELWAVRELGGQIWGVHRQTPPWLKPFYSAVEVLWSRFGMFPGVEAWSADLSRKDQRQWMGECGELAMKQIDAKVHSSEWHHVLWNDYDTVFKNTSSIETLKASVDLEMWRLGISDQNPLLRKSVQEHLESNLGKPR